MPLEQIEDQLATRMMLVAHAELVLWKTPRDHSIPISGFDDCTSTPWSAIVLASINRPFAPSSASHRTGLTYAPQYTPYTAGMRWVVPLSSVSVDILQIVPAPHVHAFTFPRRYPYILRGTHLSEANRRPTPLYRALQSGPN